MSQCYDGLNQVHQAQHAKSDSGELDLTVAFTLEAICEMTSQVSLERNVHFEKKV